MQRVTWVAGGLVALAAGILGMRFSERFAKFDAGRAGVRSSAPVLSEEEDAHAAKHHGSRAVETMDRFRTKAREIAGMPQDTARENAVRELAQEWANEDAAAAERWARGLEDAAERERAIIPVCLELAGRDPREAMRIATVNELPQGIGEAILSRWAGQDFAAAWAWAEGTSEGAARERMLGRLIQVRAAEAPGEAAGMLEELKFAGEMHEEVAIAIVHQWVLKDAEAARKWVESLPEGSARERALGEIGGVAARESAAGGGSLR